MCIICNGNYSGHTSIICCSLLTEIPIIEGLQTLDCSHCPLLTTIPNIKGLWKLVCSNCPQLTEIPNIE